MSTDKQKAESSAEQSIAVDLSLARLKTIKAALVNAPLQVNATFAQVAVMIADIHSTIKIIDDAINLIDARAQVEQLKQNTEDSKERKAKASATKQKGEQQ